MSNLGAHGNVDIERGDSFQSNDNEELPSTALENDSDCECPVLVNEKDYGIKATNAVAIEPTSDGKCNLKLNRWKGLNPLRNFSVLIGERKLSFRVVDAPVRSNIHRRDLNGRVATDKPFGSGPQTSSGSQYSCKYCGHAFAHKHSLVLHERIHTGEKPYQCPICTKCFARQTNYSVHMKLHASGRRYFCSFCGKWYRTQHEMLEHQEQCLASLQGLHVPTDRPLRYQCNFCEKMFHHRRDRNIHERTHTGERPYTCGYCGKGFTQSQALTIHIRTHTGERPYSCSLCSQTFRDSSALRKHEFMKHVNERLPGDEGELNTLDEVYLMAVSSPTFVGVNDKH